MMIDPIFKNMCIGFSFCLFIICFFAIFFFFGKSQCDPDLVKDIEDYVIEDTCKF
jgi:uncharacterized membrane protein YvbJ